MDDSTTSNEKVVAFLEKFFDSIDLEAMLCEYLIREGYVFRHPRTGKYHDRSGLGFETKEALIKYGDLFILPDRPWTLR